MATTPEVDGLDGRSKHFPGRGVLRCRFCDEPLRDHPIGPCSDADQQLFRTEEIHMTGHLTMKLEED